MASQTDGIETALATLQPIRDLAKNWDIDIATCLEQYLEDLELSEETREHVTSSLNFAQAALVLQNSSGIYSRKVDFLHAFAYKVQAELSLHAEGNNNNSKRTTTSKRTGIDAEIEEFLNYDPNLEFLLLDDVLPTDTTETGQKINLNEATATHHPQSLDTTRFSASKTLCLSLGGTRRDSMGSSLLDQTSAGGASVAAQRALMGSLDTGALRLTGDTCDIGEDGVLRIPGSQKLHPITEEALSVAQDMEIDDGSFGGGGDIFDDGLDDDQDDGPGFAMATDDVDHSDAVTITAENSGASQTNGKHVAFADAPVPSVKVQKVKADPWALLDRDTPDTKKPRPLRMGKTIVLPASVDKPPSQCVTGARTRRVARQKRVRTVERREFAINSFVAEHYQATLGKRGFERVVPLKGLAFGNEFSYIAKATAKRKADERRELRKQQLVLDEAVVPEEALDDDDGGGFDFGGDDDDNDNDFGYSAGAFGEEGVLNNNTGIASVDEIYRNRDIFTENNTKSDARSFEELCRAHIAAFARGAEKYAAETKLSARVCQWQEKLMPQLEEEELRPAFDIHEYSSAVIHLMDKHIRSRLSKDAAHPDQKLKDDSTRIVDFRDVTRDCQRHEVCRRFLAALSLTNSGNIQFAESSQESLKLQLLSSDIERPMETYLAPSADEEF